MAPHKKFTPRQRKRKTLDRLRAAENGPRRHATGAPTSDSNAELIAPEAKKEHDKKKAALRQQLLASGGGAAGKVGGKKAKRLDKYIETKLRKDETRDLLAKLSQGRIDTSLFASTRNLGQGRETKRQALGRGLREERAGLEVGKEERENLLFERRNDGEETEDEGGETAGGTSGTKAIIEEALPSHDAGVSVPVPAAAAMSAAVGSGLKRPLDVDDAGQPVLKRRKKRGGVKTKMPVAGGGPLPVSEPEDDDEYSEWEGFSSEGDDSGVLNGQAGPSDVEEDESESEEDQEEEEGKEERKEESDMGDDTSEDGDDGSDASDSGDSQDDRQQRSSAFKAWAQQKRNEALDYEPVAAATPSVLDIPNPPNFTPRPAAVDEEELPRELRPTAIADRKVFSVAVSRTPQVEESRLRLPIIAEEQRLMEAIHANDTVVICGATGSGKTTQVPQFLYEAGYGAAESDTPGMIGITQPRRVAAVSMAKRVAEELGEHGKRVAYQIRFEGTVEPDTAVKFMTDGVLLRELAGDIALRKYSAIVVDEAHERSVNTDILIGMLSRVIRLRRDLASEDPSVRPLKLIIMSATLRIEDMTQNPTLFQTPPPVLEVEGRQHPVTVHFSRRTRHDYVEEAFRKICRGHRKLPPGDILVFLTGQGEIAQLRRKLEGEFGGLRRRLEEEFVGLRSAGPRSRVRIPTNEAPMEVEDVEFGDETAELDSNGHDDDDDDDENDGDDGEFDIQEEEDGQPALPGPLKMHILPLYSLLPTHEQLRVFEQPPANSRQVILATNVAETSLTIPGVRYVFDCGRSKDRRFDPVTGVQTYEIGWVSKASANQRAGRAGRTGPGHCYRLYSSAVYESDFAEFSDPELLRMPIEGVVLQLKAMNLQNVINFPFPTPPDHQSLAKAERLLSYLTAIIPSGQITKVGRIMSIFPLAPRFSRILLVGNLHGCIHYTITLVAALSAPEVFIPENQAIPGALEDDGDEGEEEEEEGDGKEEEGTETEPRQKFRRHPRTNATVVAETRRAGVRRAFDEVHRNFSSLDDRADAIKLMQAAGEFAHEPTEAWCAGHFVRFKVLREIQLLRRQITELLAANIPAFSTLRFSDKLPRPSAKQVQMLKQMAATGFIDQIAIRADLAPAVPDAAANARKPRRAIEVPYLPLMPLAPPAGSSSEPFNPCVYIHPTSTLARLSPAECPEYVVYGHLQRAASARAGGGGAKTRMHAITDITGAQLAAIAKDTPLLRYGKPVKEITVDETAKRRECWVVPYLRGEGAVGMGWALPLRKVEQKKVADAGWVVT